LVLLVADLFVLFLRSLGLDFGQILLLIGPILSLSFSFGDTPQLDDFGSSIHFVLVGAILQRS
jgi:hypothetical protein